MPIPFALKKFLVRSGIARYLPAARRLTEGGTDFLKYYSDRVLAAPLEALLDPALCPEVAGADAVNLNLAAPAFDSPVTGARVAADRSGYPPPRGLAALRDAIAGSYLRREKRTVDPRHEVLVTHGASAAYAAVLDAFVNPGDRVVLFEPCSPLFALGARSRRASVRWVPTRTEDGKFRFDADELARALRGAMLLALSDPGNPAGGTLAPDDADKLLWAADRADVLVYLDDSFSRFRYDGPAAPLANAPGAGRRTLVAGSLTQGHGLGSVRVGWLTGSRHLVGAAALTANLAAPFVPTICQQIAARALTADDDLFGPVRDEFAARRRYTFDRLKGLGFDPVWPGGGFFIWIPVGHLGLDGRRLAERLWKEQRVLVGPGDVFGPSSAGFVRISFAADDGRLREGLGRLAEFVEELREPAGPPVGPAEDSSEAGPEAVEERPPSFSRA